MKKNILSLLLVLAMLLSLAACGSSGSAQESARSFDEASSAETAAEATPEPTTESQSNDTPIVIPSAIVALGDDEAAPKPVEEEKAPVQTDFGLGETWTVDGLLTLTILNVTETEERNEYEDSDPAAVYIIDYVYTNEGYVSDYSEGLYLYLDDTIVDAEGFMGESYGLYTGAYPKTTPIGAVCVAQDCVAVDHPGPFTITVKEYDNDYNSYSATFHLDPNEGPADVAMPVRSVSDIDYDYRIGDTWTVDGEWEFKITGVTATNDRNSYDESNPEAVYIVDYQYSNKGYEDDFMDGLYMYLDDTVVDSAGYMAYGYSGSLTNYPKETPVGATCIAQDCIGVDHAGNFIIFLSKYDSNDNLQRASFLVEVPGGTPAPASPAAPSGGSGDSSGKTPIGGLVPDIDDAADDLDDDITGTGTITLEYLLDLLESSLADSFGDNLIVKEEDGVVSVTVWEDGIATAATLAKSNSSAKDSWDEMVESFLELDGSVEELLELTGHDDYDVMLAIANDLNTDNLLLVVYNGQVVYDTVNGINLMGL